MSELVEQLRAQAVELRRRADVRTELLKIASRDRSLAELIDGMLARHFSREVANWTSLHEAHLADGFSACMNRCVESATICNACGSTECRELPHLARHVSAVLSGYTQTAREEGR